MTATNTPSTQTRALKPADEIRNNLEKMKPQFQAALPSHIDATKFLRVVQTAVASSKDILNADRTSLFASCSKAAADGLLPDGREAALVVFKNKTTGIATVQYMPMIGGILKKIRNSGELATITAQIIYKNDVFNYHIDHEGEHFHHKPDFFSDNRGEPIGAYALARTKDGAIYVEVMSRSQIMDVKNVSRGANNGPWAGAFEDQMWLKTVMRRLSKRLPSSSDLDMMFRHDDENYEFERERDETTAPKPAKKKGLRVSELVDKDKALQPSPQQTDPQDDAPAVDDSDVIDAEYQEDPPTKTVDDEIPI